MSSHPNFCLSGVILAVSNDRAGNRQATEECSTSSENARMVRNKRRTCRLKIANRDDSVSTQWTPPERYSRVCRLEVALEPCKYFCRSCLVPTPSDVGSVTLTCSTVALSSENADDDRSRRLSDSTRLPMAAAVGRACPAAILEAANSIVQPLLPPLYLTTALLNTIPTLPH
jgi:hypothetical protein